MAREGPCFHCGIKQTPLWRTGPPEKPVLCNACGSRWRTRKTLDDYIPKHASRDISYLLPSKKRVRHSARDDQKLEVGVEMSGQDGSSACLEEEMNNISSLGSAGSSSENCMWMEETNGEADKDPLWNPESVPKRKRSELRQQIVSHGETLQRKLYDIQPEPDFEAVKYDSDLIYERNKYIPPNEIGLGAMLLVSPTITTERSTPLSPVVEDNASCSMNVQTNSVREMKRDEFTAEEDKEESKFAG